jgi:uncharacterized repeat protein (TIGR03803 family)
MLSDGTEFVKDFFLCGLALAILVSPDGACAKGRSEVVLYSFQHEPDGMWPIAGLIADKAGNLYGTTWDGGTHDNGTVFELERNGVEKVLYSFGSHSADGALPRAGLIIDAAGNLYGTTGNGGDSSGVCHETGCGVVFEVTPTGTETVLYAFTDGSDGGFPAGGLIEDKKGNFFGMTAGGGVARTAKMAAELYSNWHGRGPSRCCIPFRAAATGQRLWPD